jgi:Domain of unknown function (DUF4431)
MTRSTFFRIRKIAAAAVLIGFNLGVAHGACLDISKEANLTFTGNLTFHIFGGPPYNGGVTKGDTPEPSYILELDNPICAEGDDFVDAKTKVDRIQVYPDLGLDTLEPKLQRLIGQRVTVQGKSIFGAHTGHHHAPLVLRINSAEKDSDPTDAYGTAMTTVQAFYLALAAGRGEEAARFVVPEKRRRGPFSAEAITKFYGNLDERLTLINVVAVDQREYRVRYRFVARGGKRCDGEALVKTVRLDDENLISSIAALNGC